MLLKIWELLKCIQNNKLYIYKFVQFSIIVSYIFGVNKTYNNFMKWYMIKDKFLENL